MIELTHCSYLLRLWREAAGAPWHVMLIPTAQPDTFQHFTTLEECFAFVQTQVATPNGQEYQDRSSPIVAQMAAAEKQ